MVINRREKAMTTTIYAVYVGNVDELNCSTLDKIFRFNFEAVNYIKACGADIYYNGKYYNSSEFYKIVKVITRK